MDFSYSNVPTEERYGTTLRDWCEPANGEMEDKGRVSFAGIALTIGRKPHQMASVLEGLNSASFPGGREVGRLLRTTHLAIQDRLVRYLVGILVGIGENDVVIDGRNRLAVSLCKAITDVILNDPRFADLAGSLNYIRSQPEYKRDDYIVR